MSADETIGELIERKRAAGYDAEFEALLAKRSRCLSCGHEATLLECRFTRGPAGLQFGCPVCGSEDSEEVAAKPALTVIVGGAA